jgi:hypothetical protein
MCSWGCGFLDGAGRGIGPWGMCLLRRFWWVFLLVGCGREPSWSVEVGALESPLVAPGEALEFSGRGFPVGRVGELVLDGELRAAGVGARSVTETLRVEVLSAERARALAGAGLARGHVSFSGSAVLRFALDQGASVAGRLSPVSIEWLGEEESGLRSAGDGVVRGLGFEVVDVGGEVGALRVASLDVRGAAARAGLRVGDWLEDAAGLPVRSVADLVPPSAAGSLRLGVRGDGGGRRVVNVGLSRGVTWEGLSYLAWVCPAALVLLFLGPWASPRESFERCVGRLRGARVELFGVSGATVLACAGLCCLGAWPGLGLTLWAAVAGYLSLLGLGVMRGRLAWRSLGFAAVLVFVLGASAVMSGEAGLSADASSRPWAWSLFGRPPLWIGAWIWAQCAARLHARLDGDDLAPLVLSLITASLWLGGAGEWSPQLSAAWQLGLGSAVLALKTLVVLAVLAVLPRLASASWRSLLRAAWLFAGATSLWLWLAPARALELRVGCALLSTSALAALGVALELGWSGRFVRGWIRLGREGGQELREGARAADAEGFEAEAG